MHELLIVRQILLKKNDNIAKQTIQQEIQIEGYKFWGQTDGRKDGLTDRQRQTLRWRTT